VEADAVGLVLAVEIALAADQQVLPEHALQWQPKEYPEATLHAGVAYLESEREWERMDVGRPSEEETMKTTRIHHIVQSKRNHT